ncbi:MAG: beta-lactamase family protein [Chthonomonas sp.]|nr:beta-lactamase family protein [Chthonomonas sp.]
MIRTPVAIVGLLLASASYAQDIDAVVNAEMKARKIPGLSLVITKGDKVIKRSVYGMNDLEQNTPINENHVFESGSIGKTFTATVILQLVEEGKLKLDDTLGVRYPNCPELWKPLTIRQLLTHMSGLADYATIPTLGLVDQWTYEEWLTKMPAQPFDFKTGQLFAYSNTNYLILGKIAEDILKVPITQAVQTRIFDKAGMKKSYISDQMLIIPHRAHGYLNTPQGHMNGLFIEPGYGDGTFINHPEDLVAFEKAFREGMFLKSAEVEAAQASAKTPGGRTTGYGFGWFVRNVNGIKAVSHGGNTAGFCASMMRIPSEQLTIVLMGNVHDVPGDGIALKIAEAFIPAMKYKAPAAKTDPNPERTAMLIGTLKTLSTGTLDPAQLDPEMIVRLSTARGKMGLPGLARFKDVAELAFLESSVDGPDSVLKYRGKIADRAQIFTFVVSKEGKVYSVSATPE